MGQELINEELEKMKYLFGYQKGVVISEQQTRGTSGTSGSSGTAGSSGSSASTANPDDADWSKVVNYYTGNTDASWEFLSASTYDSGAVIYDFIELKPKDTTTNGNDCRMELYDDTDAYKRNCRKAKTINGQWSWDGNKPTFTWEDRITKSSPGYVSDTDTDWSGVTNDNKIMGVGAKGSLVKKVQNFLASNGYTGETFTNDIQACATDENSCDGIYGVKTKNMVKKFQEDADIKPDGIFGYQTYEAMFGQL